LKAANRPCRCNERGRCSKSCKTITRLGDAVLKELAKIMLSHSRSHSIDICCRYGGEEFIIMPELELKNAITVAERIRKAVENHMFPIEDKKLDGKVTISGCCHQER
jgi:diguanylate cyclase (GGDEF)-like protein